MKKYSLEKYKEEKKNKKSIKITIITILILIVLIVLSLYMANRSFRSFIDTHILHKEIASENANALTIDTENLSLIYPYDDKLAIYTDGNINIYNDSAKNIANIEITLSKPIADTEADYLVLGDYESQKVCLIKSNNLVWQKDIEGKVSKVNVNKKGYVAVSVFGTTYESIVMVFNPKGELMFSDYLSTYVIETEISEDNKYLAIAQIDNSGISPTSKIEIISINKAIEDSSNATVNTYQAETNEMLTGIKYQGQDKLLCCFDDYVVKMDDKESKKIYECNDLTAYVDAHLSNGFVRIDKEQSSVFKSDYRLKICNEGKKEKVYIVEGSLKELKTAEKVSGINLGMEVQFINNNGWLIKKYTTKQEFKEFKLSRKLGIIIYDEKIDIIKL